MAAIHKYVCTKSSDFVLNNYSLVIVKNIFLPAPEDVSIEQTLNTNLTSL
jgi:hypothetical protein